jgi:hypothetical protein
MVGSTPTKSVTSIRSKNYSVCAAVSKRGLLYWEVKDLAYNSKDMVKFLNFYFKDLKMGI